MDNKEDEWVYIPAETANALLYQICKENEEFLPIRCGPHDWRYFDVQVNDRSKNEWTK